MQASGGPELTVWPEGQEGYNPRVLWSQPPEEPCRLGKNLGLLPKMNRKHLKSLGRGEAQSNLGSFPTAARRLERSPVTRWSVERVGGRARWYWSYPVV